MAKSSLSKKFDQIKKREEEKTFSTKKRSRIVSKFLNNRLAVIGLIIFSIIVLASIFTLGSIRKTQNLYYIFIAIISCVVIYFFKDLSIALAETNRISLMLSIWMPIIAIGLFCSIGVIQINEK